MATTKKTAKKTVTKSAAVAKKTAKKKTTTKPKATKKTATKVAKTTAEKKTTTAGRKPKEGLRKPQIALLQAALKSKNALTRPELSAAAEVDNAACTEYIGSVKEEVRTKNDAKHFPSLVSLGLLKQEVHDIDGKDVVLYSITAAGKKAIDN